LWRARQVVAGGDGLWDRSLKVTLINHGHKLPSAFVMAPAFRRLIVRFLTVSKAKNHKKTVFLVS
jgi:hypothetical protein